jgi:hypothetical protein
VVSPVAQHYDERDYERHADLTDRHRAILKPPSAHVWWRAPGEYAIKCPSPLNVLKDTYDHSWYCARSDEYQHLMTDSPGARRPGGARENPPTNGLTPMAPRPPAGEGAKL